VYENYLKQKQIKRKETVKEKKTKQKKSDIQLEMPALGCRPGDPLVPVGITNRDLMAPFNPGCEARD